GPARLHRPERPPRRDRLRRVARRDGDAAGAGGGVVRLVRAVPGAHGARRLARGDQASMREGWASRKYTVRSNRSAGTQRTWNWSAPSIATIRALRTASSPRRAGTLAGSTA